MSRLRRCLNGAVFLGFLSAVAMVVFLYVRRSPRCVIAESVKGAVTVLLAPDGTRLMTMPGSPFVRGGRGGPGSGRLWDTRSGQLLDEVFGDNGVGWFELSPDRRHLAAYVADGKKSSYGKLWLVDWHTGEKHQLDVQRVHALGFKFSSTGRWLFVATNTPGPVASRGILAERTVVFDVATKRIVLSLQSTFPKSSNDDRRLFVHDWPDKETAVWDLESGKKLVDLMPAEFPNEADFVTSPDDRVFLSWQSWKREVDAWDLTTLTKRFRRVLARPAQIRPVFSPDSRTLAIWLLLKETETELEMLDATTGRLLWTFADPTGITGDFSPDGSLCFVVHGGARKTLTMFDASTGRALWERRHSFARFAGSKGILLHQEDDSKPIEFLEARTGVRQAVAPNNFDYRSAAVTFTPDGRYVAIRGSLTRNREMYVWEEWLETWWPEVFFTDRPAVLVLEMPTGSEMFRASKWANWNYVLSDDASTLVIVDQQEGNADNRCIIWIWDVHPTKAWLWAVGAVIATGLGWTALRRAWCKLKTRKSASQQTSLPSASA